MVVIFLILDLIGIRVSRQAIVLFVDLLLLRNLAEAFNRI